MYYTPNKVHLEVSYSMKGNYAKCLCSASEIQSDFVLKDLRTHVTVNDTLSDDFDNRVKVSATYKITSENIDTVRDCKVILKRFVESLKFPDYVEVNDIEVELGE